LAGGGAINKRSEDGKNSWLSSEEKKKQGNFVGVSPVIQQHRQHSLACALWSLLWLTCVHVHCRSHAMALKHFSSSTPELLFNSNQVF
jgi:hypothetical protein